MQDVCSLFSPLLVEDLMGNLVWEDSDKWPVCGEGIRKKGKGEKREDNTEGMLFLEEHFKEEADHVTAMGNTICIFHKSRGNQHYDSPHSMIPPVFGQRGCEGQGQLCICVPWTVTSLLLPLWYDLPRKWQHIPVTITPQHSLPHRTVFFLYLSWKQGINPLWVSILCRQPCSAPVLHREEERGLPAHEAQWPGMTPTLRERPCNEAMQKTAEIGRA